MKYFQLFGDGHYTYRHIYAHPRIHKHIYVHLRTSTHIYAHLRTSTHTHKHIYIYAGERVSQHDRPFLRPRGGQEFRGRMALFGRACVRGMVSAQCMRRVSRYTTLHASFGRVCAQSQKTGFARVLGRVYAQSQKTGFARVLWHNVCADSANARLLHTSLAATFSQYKSIFSGHAQALRDKPLRRRGTPPQ